MGVDFTDWRFFVHEKQLYFLEFHLNYLLCLSLTINYTAYHLKKKKKSMMLQVLELLPYNSKSHWNKG